MRYAGKQYRIGHDAPGGEFRFCDDISGYHDGNTDGYNRVNADGHHTNNTIISLVAIEQGAWNKAVS